MERRREGEEGCRSWRDDEVRTWKIGGDGEVDRSEIETEEKGCNLERCEMERERERDRERERENDSWAFGEF